MRSALARNPATVPIPEAPEVEFGRSAEDFPVARVADNALAMLPARDGRHYLATGWRIERPIAERRRSDFLRPFRRTGG